MRVSAWLCQEVIDGTLQKVGSIFAIAENIDTVFFTPPHD